MRSKSLRHESSKRRKWVALLALLTPAVGWSAEPARAVHSDSGSIPQSGQSDGPAQATEGQPTSSNPSPLSEESATATPLAGAAPELVPLSPQQSGSYGSAMALIGPVSRSAGQPAAASGWASDDAWIPRGSRAPLQTPNSPLRPTTGSNGQVAKTDVPTDAAPQLSQPPSDAPPRAVALDAPANERPAAAAAANETVPADAAIAGDDAQPTLDVTDPEQNEPAGSSLPDSAESHLSEPHLDGLNASFADPVLNVLREPNTDSNTEAPGTTATGETDDDAKPAEDQPRQGMEIRRLQLRSHGSSAAISARPASNRTGARMSVGDMPLSADRGHLDEPAESLPAELPRASAVTDQPIYGDRITAEGELILASGSSASGLPVLPQTAQLKPTIEAALRYYWDRPEDSAERTHWGMMHSIMVFDKDTQIVHRRQRYNAVAWMAGNNPCRNQLLFGQDQHGINVRTGVGLQGHQAQLLAIFGLVDVPLHYPVYAGRQKYSVADILEREKLDCKSGNELTFTLIALAHYADSDSTWVAGDQQDWDVQRVLREEMAQPIVGAACGGTHRLMGFAHALRRRRAEDKPIVQQWDRADRYVKEFVNYTWTLQNRDGSMSTAWFERPEDNGNMDRKIQTTGHMLEFLLSTLPDAELQSPKMIRTVSYLANTLHTERGHQWQIGPKGHALRALAMYHQRVFAEPAPWRGGGESRRTAGSPAGRGVR